jgi:cardiolipin synthase
MKQRWTTGNKFTLLENGEEYFPRVFEVIAGAQREVLLETFILYDDKVGRELQGTLIDAAQRGVQIDMTIDGFGSPDLSDEFLSALTSAGVRVHVFDPGHKLLGQRTNLFRRMHRKLVVVDGVRAFAGGINYSADHLADYGPEAKQDYAVEIEGPIVVEIHSFLRTAMVPRQADWRWLRRVAAPPAAQQLTEAGPADAMFVWRDNDRHKDDIERHYRVAIRLARKRVIIANAYFFPGYGLLREMRHAARRGVKVSLILQGNPDMPIVQTAAGLLYSHLLKAGVRIFEYCERPLHGKVALVDDEWATVGSSNLDPLSLALNLEANVMIRDRGFNRQLDASLQRLLRHSCKEIKAANLRESGLGRALRGFLLFHILRRYPAWIGWLPAHAPKVKTVRAPVGPATSDPTGDERLASR